MTLAFESATTLISLLDQKTISSKELTDYFIRRIEQFDKRTNAVVVRDFDRARESSTQADQRLKSEGLKERICGLPITLKESFNVKGLPTTFGVPALKNNISQQDSEVARKLKSAGGIILGLTNVPIHLADYQSYNDIYGQTNNPWDLTRTPGGSSGGSAAALAAGLTALEFGSDIGGSLRNPAHYCGVYAHKPTYGIVSCEGHTLPKMYDSHDLGVCGPMARNAEDLALGLDIIAGPHSLNARGWKLALPPSPTKRLSDFKVAIWQDDSIAQVASEISDHVQNIADVLSQCGASVSDTVRPDFNFIDAQNLYITLMNGVYSSGMSAPELTRLKAEAAQFAPDDFSRDAVRIRGQVQSHSDWLSNLYKRDALRKKWNSFFDEWDILICPQMPTTAFPHDHSPPHERKILVDGREQLFFAATFWAGLATCSYLPSTVFPTGLSRQGLPIGLQAISSEYNDYKAIEFTRLIAQEIGGFIAPPGYEDMDSAD